MQEEKPKNDEGTTEWRQVIIETDGSNIRLAKNEVTMLELRQIVTLMLQQLSK